MQIATSKLYSKLAEAAGLNISELEKRLGLGNATIASAIKRGSVIRKSMLDKMSKTFPELDIEALARQTSENENAQLLEEPGVEYNAQDFWTRIDKAVQAATDAAKAATRLADVIESRLSPLLENSAEHAARIAAIYRWLDVSLEPILDKKPGQIAAELSTTFHEIQEEKRKDIPVGAGK